MKKSILETVHESVRDLHDAGVVDKQTMREFDSLCLPKVKEYTSAQIKEIRLRNKASQAVFAAYLNTGVETVRKWEASGKTRKRPNGAAMKLISIIDKHGLDLLGAA
ncbi:MAG TPA: DNA-binding transcriptional regulator [Gammaproteobacteria bacterium]|nr:DNA-binding transcriptional regulator [Gammaproteobacteria bacterium]